MLLYLVKNSQTKLTNAVHELSKCMDEENMIYYKDLLRAINEVIYTKDCCYQMKPDRNINVTWKLRGYRDAGYAEDNDTQKSMKVFFLTEQSLLAINDVRKKLQYLLQNLNIHKSRRYVGKYYLSVIFYCLWELLLNTPLLCMLINNKYTVVLQLLVASCS